jgi:hypothetical protein
MSANPAEQSAPPRPYAPTIGAAAPAQPVRVPPEFPPKEPTTGTEDDDDEPEDEHDGENEASERASNEHTEAPEEFEYDDEDRK